MYSAFHVITSWEGVWLPVQSNDELDTKYGDTYKGEGGPPGHTEV